MATSNSLTSFTSVTPTTITIGMDEGSPSTTSLDVARHFGKRHVDVLRAIENLLLQLPDEHKRIFAFMFTDVALGQGATRKDPAYRMTRDGFTLLAMSFTGAKALQFKLAYIDAFNEMERVCADNAAKLKLANALAETETVLLKQVEAHYKEQCLHSIEHELGSALIGAVKCSDEDNEGILHQALKGVDLAGAADVVGCSTDQMRARALAHISATSFIGKLKRGEAEQHDPVIDVVSWARSVVASRAAKERLVAYRLAREKQALTLQQIDANDRAHKHDYPAPAQAKPRSRRRKA